MFTKGITRVGTLGNDVSDVTCSILAIKSLNEPITIVPFREFELIVDSLVAEDVDAMVVPGAYPNIAKFIMNDSLAVYNVFTSVIPALVFASKYSEPKNEYETLYNHPATNALMPEIKTKWGSQISVSSNSVACLKVLEDAEKYCAITNSSCAQQYGLNIHQVLREGINMPFIIFIKVKTGGR